ncbi:thermonuclease family protein [Cellulomonas sp. McL0617]|uniref:thermonuclease family protein n=1 Tax=Cellulomonas sp. McL0617 TaxID=3415675 RepID=UPI003CF72B32
MVRVVDGDTIDVRYDGAKHRIRLLSIDAPESVDPAKPVECLGPEASAYLKVLLPVGTEVSLKQDKVKVDKYDRELAAVFVGKVNTSSALARAGLAVPIAVGKNKKFYAAAQRAQQQARDAHRGLYGNHVPCTVPAQVKAYETTVDQALAAAPVATDLATLDAYAAQLAAAVATGSAITALVARDQHDRALLGLGRTVVTALGARVASSTGRLAREQATNVAARTTEVQRLETDRVAAEQAAAAAQAEGDRVAAQAAAAAKKATAKKVKPAVPAKPAPAAPAPAAPAAPDTSGSSSGRAPCRKYAPGGKTFVYIDCTTKLPLG